MFISGLMCDTDTCNEMLLYQAHAPGIRKISGSRLPGKSDLMRYGRERGWSIGTKILCPNCRRKFGKPKTLRQIKNESHANFYKYRAFSIDEFIDMYNNGEIEPNGYGKFHDGYTVIDDELIDYDNALTTVNITKYKYILWYRH